MWIAGEGTWIAEIDFKVIKYLKNDTVRIKLTDKFLISFILFIKIFLVYFKADKV